MEAAQWLQARPVSTLQYSLQSCTIAHLPLEYKIEWILQEMSSSATDRRYALEEIPGKGIGLVATIMIRVGTRILSGDCVGKAGIYLDACNIDHPCDNSVHKLWNADINRHANFIHTKRDINNGEKNCNKLSPHPHRQIKGNRVTESWMRSLG